ncbi:putative boron transporter 2 [Tanacetum coccineum]
MASFSSSTVISDRALSKLMDLSGKTKIPQCMKFFFMQHIAEEKAFANLLRDQCEDVWRHLTKLHVMNREMEAIEDCLVVFDIKYGIHEKEGHADIMDLSRKQDHGDMVMSSNASAFAPTCWIKSLIAEYGVPLMVLVWNSVSYALAGSFLTGIPRCLFSPNPWSPGAYHNCRVIKSNLSPGVVWNGFADL